MSGTSGPLRVDPAALHRVMAWFSPAFPVGAFSYSGGLETAIDRGLVNDGPDLEDWIAAAVSDGPAWQDAVLFTQCWTAATHNDPQTLIAVAELAAALRGSRELAIESVNQGRAFWRTTELAWTVNELKEIGAALETRSIDMTLPVAAACACASTHIDLATGLFAYVHAYAANAVSVGVRLIPLGQTEGQQILAALGDALKAAASTAMRTDLADLGTATPMIDLCSMLHETQYMRLFQS